MVSKYWQELNKAHVGLMEEYGYENFKASVGRIYNDDMEYEKVLESIRILWEMLYRDIPEELLKKFSEPLIGNPAVLMCEERPVSIDLGCAIREYYLLSQYIDFSKINSIVEIGGGYGRTAYVINKLHPKIRYTMCDIEPSLSLAKRYLFDVAPSGKFNFILPEQLNSGECDLLLAINCLHEMVKEDVNMYFDYADRKAKYFYYSCWNETTIPLDGITWNKQDYPIKDKWIEMLNQGHIRSDFFEVLYKI